VFEFSFHETLQNRRPIVVLLHGRQKPEAERWAMYLHMLRNSYRPDLGPLTVFVVTDGGGPDAGQRKALSTMFHDGAADTHVFSTDVVVRGIVTALHWLGSSIVAHHPAEFSAVCKKSGHSANHVLEMLDKAQVGAHPNRTLHVMRKSIGTASPSSRAAL
jgi:hypothetical protein